MRLRPAYDPASVEDQGNASRAARIVFEWVCFEDSSHTPHVEERERYMHVVGDWLAKND